MGSILCPSSVVCLNNIVYTSYHNILYSVNIAAGVLGMAEAGDKMEDDKIEVAEEATEKMEGKLFHFLLKRCY